MRKEKTVFVPGTKNQPEARKETLIAGITFMHQYESTDQCPDYVFRFEDPIRYQFTDEEASKPHNWLPPIFKKVRRGRTESRFVRLEYTDDTKTTTRLVFSYTYGYSSDEQQQQFTTYTWGTLRHLMQMSGLPDAAERTQVTLQTESGASLR